MSDNISVIVSKVWNLRWQILKFGVVGSSNTIIDFGLYFLLTRYVSVFSLHYLWANAMAFYVANLNSFVWNKHWTFTQAEPNPKPWLRQYVEFFSISLIYIFTIQFGLWLLVSEFLWPDLLAKALMTVIATTLYFSIVRKVVF